MSRGRRVLANVIGLALVMLVCGLFIARYRIVYVHGGSMEPALFSGDLVVVDPKRSASAGDMLLVREPGHPAVLHRAVRHQSGSWVTKGDANPVSDFLRARDSSVRGVVVRVVPFGALLQRWQ